MILANQQTLLTATALKLFVDLVEGAEKGNSRLWVNRKTLIILQGLSTWFK